MAVLKKTPLSHVIITGAREHNLKNVSLSIPKNQLVVFTGLSGSGKSSLAFDTIYAEGQRRYVESLSAYARQFLGIMEKPDVDVIEGLSPAISIEQKTTGCNPRSTVGTVTEIYDYLRLLWARVGIPHCPSCGRPVRRQSATQIAEQILSWPAGSKIEVLAPLVRGRKGEFRDLFDDARKKGFVRARVDGELIDLEKPPKLNRYENHSISIVVDRLVVRADDRSRLTDSLETALKAANGITEIIVHADELKTHLFSEKYACVHCGTSMAELEPRQFSFNSPYGACEGCGGLGTRKEVSPELVIGDSIISILEGVILPWGEPSGHLKRSVIPGLADHYDFEPNRPWGQLSDAAKKGVLYGSGGKKIKFPYKVGGSKGDYSEPWEGVLTNVKKRYDETTSETIREQLEQYMSTLPCAVCRGTRLKPESLAVTVGGKSIGEVIDMSVSESLEFFKSLKTSSSLPAEIAGRSEERR